MVPVDVRRGPARGVFLFAIDAGGGHQIHLRLEGVGCHAGLAGRVFVLFAQVLIIEPRRQRDPDGILHADVGVGDFQLFEVFVVENHGGIGGQAERAFEIVERLLVAAHGADPGALRGQFLLFQPAEVRLSDSAFPGQRAGAFGVLAGVLQIQIAVAHRIPVLQDTVVRGGDIDAEPFPKQGEIAESVEQVALELRQVFHGHLVARAAPERLAEGPQQVRGDSSARIAAQVAQKIRREGSGQPGARAEEDASQGLAVGVGGACLRQLFADHRDLPGWVVGVGDVIHHVRRGHRVVGGAARRKNGGKLMAGQRQFQRPQKQLFLLILVNPAVIDPDVQSSFQGNNVRAPLDFTVRAEEFLHTHPYRQPVQRELVRLLHAEAFVHVFDQRRFLSDDAVSLFIRRLAIMPGRTASQNEKGREHSRQRPGLEKPLHAWGQPVYGRSNSHTCSFFANHFRFCLSAS